VLSYRFAVLLISCGLVASGCDSWPMFRHGPDRTGFNRVESRIGVGNVAQLREAWTGATGGDVRSSPAVVGGVAYVGSLDGKLYAFDARGRTGCAGAAPKTCAPLWTAQTGAGVVSSPAVVKGVVYVGSLDAKLYAFDARGTTGCRGTPKVCAPLWTAATGPLLTSSSTSSSPVVAGGVVYAGSDGGKLFAFDAAGTTGCSGMPKTCAPLWTGAALHCIIDIFCKIFSPAVRNGVVYAGSDESVSEIGLGFLYAFDAAGVRGCSGTPKTCSPLWSGRAGGVMSESPALANRIAYVSFDNFDAESGPLPGTLAAFDAAGMAGCSGAPKQCGPLWSGSLEERVFKSSPAVANGVVYAGSDSNKLYAFDAAGAVGCSGAPKICTPLWTATTGNDVRSSPAVANGIVYVGSDDGKLYAFDAAGAMGCSGTPKTCAPLFAATTGGAVSASPAILDGTVYVGSDDDKVHAYALP
jgi:outer membrane protein assembly factor BamB